MSVWDWMSTHSAVINIAVNTAMLAVWIFYLQLLFNGYKRQRESSILVTRGAGAGLHARCLITNMSQEPVYVTSLIVNLEADSQWREVQLTDMRELPNDLGTDPRSVMRQGSLERGRYLDVGQFGTLIGQLSENDPDVADPSSITAIEVTVVALYGPETLPVGAKRCFDIIRSEDGGTRIKPRSVITEQLHARHQRKSLLREMDRFL